MECFLEYDNQEYSNFNRRQQNAKIVEIRDYFAKWGLNYLERVIFSGPRMVYVLDPGTINSVYCFNKTAHVKKVAKTFSKKMPEIPNVNIQWMIIPNGWKTIMILLGFTFLYESSVQNEKMMFRVTNITTGNASGWNDTMSSSILSYFRIHETQWFSDKRMTIQNVDAPNFDMVQLKFLQAANKAVQLGMYSHCPLIECLLQEFIEHHQYYVDNVLSNYITGKGYPQTRTVVHDVFSKTIPQLALYIHNEYENDIHQTKRQRLVTECDDNSDHDEIVESAENADSVSEPEESAEYED